MSSDSAVPAYRTTTQYKALVNMLKTVRAGIRDSGLDKSTAELMNLLSSSINGCEACWVTHAREARRVGVDEQKMQILQYMEPRAAIRHEVFSASEQAALYFAFAFTVPAEDLISEARREASRYFSSEQLTAMEWLTIAINSFNRITIAHEDDADA
ncbi:carboxymuconolactone decarboxylase family protein [Corynebacterium sp. ED61]|uniref:carboxymuconolactone decarboxylase family protein n=1 Tax=Corynebacterium sp. ED61 TaxID=2211360 RepID=UPI001883CD34|nr:carboxymuconolactone decarboxylase family protein [Corynebacterium sp. ED61]MBF0582201.1 carboxymuconolactone decarboxylase family protein [Corynebacterium sp. ED61]